MGTYPSVLAAPVPWRQPQSKKRRTARPVSPFFCFLCMSTNDAPVIGHAPDPDWSVVREGASEA